MTREYIVKKNVTGHRIGESHHKAVLSDAEVEMLISDRGPEDAPAMSYRQLAERYGISKSSVRDILTARRRAQIGSEAVTTQQPVRTAQQQQRVRVKLTLPLYLRAQLHRMGGSKWVERLVMSALNKENLRTRKPSSRAASRP